MRGPYILTIYYADIAETKTKADILLIIYFLHPHGAGNINMYV